MICKAIKGKGFRGALNYDLEKGRILDTCMAGQTPRELAKEFGEVRKLRPTLGKSVLHVSLSAALGENLTDKQWGEIGRYYLQGMGFDDNQYVITRHEDTKHEHIHILVNRIKMDGSVVSDSQDYKRQEVIMREIERDYGLRIVENSKDVDRKAPTKGEIEGAIRTETPSIKMQLQDLCDAAAKDCKTFTEYQERLESVGVELIPTIQMQGAKMSGLMYRLDGALMKGSDLGKGYSPAGLSKRGVTYEQDRDFASADRSIKREARRAFGDEHTVIEGSEVPERGRLGQNIGASGLGHGQPDGRDPADIGRARQDQQNAGLDVQRSLESGIERSGQAGRSGEKDRDVPLRAGSSDRVGYSTHHERILALSSTTENPELAGRGGSRRVPQAGTDRTIQAIQRQIDAFGVGQFEVGIREAKTGQMMNRTWGRDELEQSAAWLKRMNAKGNDVYIRPAGEHGLVLVDDLPSAKVEQMRKDGWKPAAVVETSPGNHQAWVKLSDKPLSAETRRIAAQGLAKHYGGDMNSADSKHYGRLAGFTNQKPKHTRDGRQPYVLAHDCPGAVAKAAPAYVEKVRAHLDAQRAAEAQKQAEMAREAERKARLDRINANQGFSSADPGREYQRQAKRILGKYGADADMSRLDYMVAKDMAKAKFTPEQIAGAIEAHSPNIGERKAGHVDDYAMRTATNASQEVMQERAALAKARAAEIQIMGRLAPRSSQDRDKGMGR